MSLKLGTVSIDVLPAVVPFLAGDLQSSACVDEEIKESCELEAYCCTTAIDDVSVAVYEKGWGIAIVMVLLNNLRFSPFTARIAEFLTTVFQLLRYEVVQAYRRLKHFLRHEDRPAVDACPREFVSSQPSWSDAIVQGLFKVGVTRIKHAQEQQPLSDRPYGSSWQWNYRSFRVITSRHLAATWEDEETQIAAKAA